MALKARIKSLNDVPEELRSFYTPQGDEQVLSVEGMVHKDKVDEFRSNNIDLKRQIDDLTKKFSDVDLDQYRELREKAQKERDKKLIDAGRVDELVAERTNAMKADYDKQLKLLGDEKGKLTTQLEGLVIDNAIRDSSTKAGVRASAVDDVLLRGRQLFRLQDGKAVPMEGDRPVFGKSGEPMSIDEWVGGLSEKAPHLFEPSNGGGSKQASGSSKHLAPNTIARDDKKGFLSNLDKIAKGEIRVSQ